MRPDRHLRSQPESPSQSSPAVERRPNSPTAPRRLSRRWLAVAVVVVTIAVGIALLIERWGRPKIDVDRAYTDGLLAMQRGDNEEAAKLLDEVLREIPAHYETLLYRGQIARDTGQPAAALEFWARVPDQPARFGGTARFLEAVALFSQGQSRKAEQKLLHSIALNPTYLQPRDRLVELYVLQMRRDDVRHQLQEIGKLRPWTLEELVLTVVVNERVSSTAEGIRQTERFVSADPSDEASVMALIRYLAEERRYDDALLRLRSALKTSNGSALRGMLAHILVTQNQPEQAADALFLGSDNAEWSIWYWRGCASYWTEQEDWQRAADCLRYIVAADDEDLAAQQQLGVALEHLGKTDEGKRHLHRAQLLDRLFRQASRIPRRKRQNDQLLCPIAIDVAESLVALDRAQEAQTWLEMARSIQSDDPKLQHQLVSLESQIQAGFQRPPSLSAAKPQDIQFADVQHLIPTPPKRTAARPPTVNPPKSKIRLRDVHELAGIEFQYFNGQTGLKYLVESMGGGVAILDYDADGWPDIFLPQGCSLPFNPENSSHTDRLFRNLGNGKFADVTEAAGLADNRYGQGCATGDFDNDGDADLFVANFGENSLFLNNGDGTFSEIAGPLGLRCNKWASSAAWADLDRDGDLDLYIVTYVDSLRVCHGESGKIAACDPQNFGSEDDFLFENLGDGTFRNVSESAGILVPDGKGLGIVIADLDEDQWPDIYIANDGTPNFLFKHKGQGLQFDSVGMIAGAAVNDAGQAAGGMGIACADFDDNGLLDLYVTNFFDETNTMYANDGQMLFRDKTRATNTWVQTLPMVGFGVQAIDLDLDGIQDMVIGNGHIDDNRHRNEGWKMRPQAFRGLGKGKFEDISDSVGEFFHGEYLGRGLARIDWDRDGDPDFVLVNQEAPLGLLSNETSSLGGSLVLELHGDQSNRDAIGTVIRVTSLGKELVSAISGGDGFFSSNERRQIIGLGKATEATLTIEWPSGLRQTQSGIPAGSVVVWIEGQRPEVGIRQ